MTVPRFDVITISAIHIETYDAKDLEYNVDWDE